MRQISNRVRSGHKYKVGDKVTFTNDYGVVFTNKIIVELDYDDSWHDPQPRYYISPTDSPWVSVAESNLMLDCD